MYHINVTLVNHHGLTNFWDLLGVRHQADVQESIAKLAVGAKPGDFLWIFLIKHLRFFA